MLYTNYSARIGFYYTCTFIFLLVFATTSIAPLHSYEKTLGAKGIIKRLDPTRKVRKYIKELESFSSTTSIDELMQFIQSFKAFTEEQTGTRIHQPQVSMSLCNLYNLLKLLPKSKREHVFHQMIYMIILKAK